MTSINTEQITQNLKNNWLYPISAAAFFCLSATGSKSYRAGIIVAFIIHFAIAAAVPSIWSYIQNRSGNVRVFAALSALGVCWDANAHFQSTWLAKLEGKLPIFPHSGALAINLCGAMLSLVFVYIAVIVFCSKLKGLFSDCGLLTGVRKLELLYYLILFAGLFCAMTAAFCKTNAFYGVGRYDVIYTSDSVMIHSNVYTLLTHSENDLRQPLFAVFAAPFAALPHLIGKILSTYTAEAILINAVQLALLFISNFMLARMLELAPIKRACFMLLSTFTYTNLLFTLMMEQYIVGYFWLTCCMYLVCTKGSPKRFTFWGASGTLLTSGVMVLFMSASSPIKSFKSWARDIIRCCLEFLLCMLAFCRFDIIYGCTASLSSLMRFGGKGLDFEYKALQYLNFVISYFFAPKTEIVDDWAWRLCPPNKANLAGIMILGLCAVSLMINRNQKISRLAAGWCGFSIVVLLILGWGTKENGLILYSLYFGWCFLVLLFQLINMICDKLHSPYALPLVSICLAAVMAKANIPAFIDMLKFAVAHYPA